MARAERDLEVHLAVRRSVDPSKAQLVIRRGGGGRYSAFEPITVATPLVSGTIIGGPTGMRAELVLMK